MTYVPIVPNPPAPPSPRTMELAARLTHLIRDYETDHPEMTRAEVEQALGLARRAAGGSAASREVAMVAAGLLVAAGLAAFLLLERGGGVGVPVILPAIVGVALVLGLVVVLRRGP